VLPTAMADFVYFPARQLSGVPKRISAARYAICPENDRASGKRSIFKSSPPV
jgi:hypothetical protein